MADKFVKINELSDEARQAAVKKFAEFYVTHYHNGDLDVISEQDHKATIVEINQFLIDNNNFLHAELMERLLAARFTEFVRYLEQVNQTYSEDGQNTKKSWEQWLKDEDSKADDKEALS